MPDAGKGIWVVKDAPFVDDWTEEDYQTLIDCLKNTVDTGGVVYAALCGKALKGFVSVYPICLEENRSIWTFPTSMFLKICEIQELEPLYFFWQKNGPENKGRISCIFPPIPQWKPRTFTKKWAAWRHRFITSSMSTQNRMTASWNAALYEFESPAAGHKNGS